MTFDAPYALALLALVPLAIWIHRARRGTPEIRVASLDAFRGAADAERSTAPRRAFDAPFAALVVAMALLALAAARPVLGRERPPAFRVVLDRSPSMRAVTCDAAVRVGAALAAADPEAVREDHDLCAGGEADGLPDSLAPHLAAARAAGFAGVVLVTDRAVAGRADVAVIGPSAMPERNASIASATLDGEAAVITVRNHGATAASATVRGARGDASVVIEPRGVASVRLAAPARGDGASYLLDCDGDQLAADDRLDVVRRGGARRVRLLPAGTASVHVRAALRACGVTVTDDAGADLDVLCGGEIPAAVTRPTLVIAPASAAAGAPIAIERDTARGPVAGARVVGRGPLGDVLPSPHVALAAVGRLHGGDGAWSDDRGVLVSADGALVVWALDPEDPACSWHRDPSFPAAVAAALDAATGGPERLAAVQVTPSSESHVGDALPHTSSPEELRAVLRPGGPDGAGARPGAALAAVAALLLLFAAVAARR